MKSIKRLEEIEKVLANIRINTAIPLEKLLGEKQGILLALEDVREIVKNPDVTLIALRINKLLKQSEKFK